MVKADEQVERKKGQGALMYPDGGGGAGGHKS